MSGKVFRSRNKCGMTYSEFTRLYVEAYKLLVNEACGGFASLLPPKATAVRAAPAGGSEKKRVNKIRYL